MLHIPPPRPHLSLALDAPGVRVLADYDPSVHVLTDPLFLEPLDCICVDSSLSSRAHTRLCTLPASTWMVSCPRASTPHPYTLPDRTRTLLCCERVDACAHTEPLAHKIRTINPRRASPDSCAWCDFGAQLLQAAHRVPYDVPYQTTGHTCTLFTAALHIHRILIYSSHCITPHSPTL